MFARIQAWRERTPFCFAVDGEQDAVPGKCWADSGQLKSDVCHRFPQMISVAVGQRDCWLADFGCFIKAMRPHHPDVPMSDFESYLAIES